MGTVNKSKAKATIKSLTERVDIIEKNMGMLSNSMQQLVVIAKAMEGDSNSVKLVLRALAEDYNKRNDADNQIIIRDADESPVKSSL